jgi:hypothetical protein
MPRVREIEIEVKEQEFVDATNYLPDQDRLGNGDA